MFIPKNLWKLSIALVICGYGYGVPSSESYAQPKVLRWILNGRALGILATDETSKAFFAGTQPFISFPAAQPVSVPTSWGALHTRIFPSYGAFEKAIEAGKIAPDVKAVLYDNEAWSFTPAIEQTHFADYARRFSELAHQHGYRVIQTPAINLAKAQQIPEEKRFAAFLRLGYPAAAAKYADVYEIQAQGSQIPVATFASYVRDAAQQARQANPKILVFAGLSTNPSGHSVNAQQIIDAVQATRNIVDGYWLNVPTQGPSCPHCNDFRPDIAIEVLKKLK